MSMTLSINSIDLHYGAAQALKSVSLHCKPNRITAVLGRNGVGKSSTLRAITGMNQISAGGIILDGEMLEKSPPYKRARMGLGYVPQGREIFPLLTVRENLETGYAGLKRADKNVPSYIFELFPVLKSMLGRRGGDLSGGQQQQLAIGRALVTRPKVLVLDEPTEGIQPSIIREMGRTLKQIRDQRGLSIVVSEQVLSFALDIADRILVIEKGEIVHEELRATVDEAKVASYLSV